MSHARLVAVCVVHELIPGPRTAGVTGIDKRPRSGRVEVGPLGLAGDEICDTAHHGGPGQAVYAYADEDAAWWASELGREIPPGLFGENLRTAGIDLTGAEIGERWRIGGEDGVVVHVTAPRIPCVTFAQRMGEPHWVKRFTDRGAPGAYLAVLSPGTVGAGDAVDVVHRPGHGVTIGDLFPAPSRSVARRLLDAEAGGGADFELTPKVRAWARRQATSPS